MFKNVYLRLMDSTDKFNSNQNTVVVKVLLMMSSGCDKASTVSFIILSTFLGSVPASIHGFVCG